MMLVNFFQQLRPQVVGWASQDPWTGTTYRSMFIDRMRRMVLSYRRLAVPRVDFAS